MEQQLKLIELLKIIRSQWLFVATVILTACLSVILYVTYVATPMYEASTQILVNQKTANESYSWDQTEADLKLINTYYVMVKSPIILNEVIATLNLSKTPKELERQITITNENDSTVMNLSVHASEPMLAVELVNTIAAVFEQQIPLLMNVNNIRVLSKAELAQSEMAVSPNKMLYVIVTAIVSTVCSLMLAFVREMLNKSVRADEEFEQLLHVPIIAVISPIRPSRKKAIGAKMFVRKKVSRVEAS